MSICDVVGCGKPHRARGLSGKHVSRFYRKGSIADSPTITLEERFWARVKKTPECWIWQGSLQEGYGQLNGHNVSRLAHRVSYEIHKGQIPRGLQLDHLCRNRACVNPNHLEAVSCKTNVLRGMGPAAMNARKTHCPKGHVYDANNTLMIAKRRQCRECSRVRSLFNYYRKQALKALESDGG